MKHQSIHLCFYMICSILLSLLLTSCGIGITNSLNTSMGAVPTANWPLYENHHLKTTGYSLQYPPGWQIKEANLFVSFSDTKNLSSFSVSPTAESNFGSLSDTTLEQDSITKYINTFKATAKNAKDIGITGAITYAGATSPPGITWEQAGETGNVHMRSQVVNEETFIMANYNRQQHLTYILQFTAPTSLFISNNSAYFQSMIESFAYTS